MARIGLVSHAWAALILALMPFPACGSQRKPAAEEPPAAQKKPPAPAVPSTSAAPPGSRTVKPGAREWPIAEFGSEMLGACEHYFGAHVAMDGALLVVSSPRSGQRGELVVYRQQEHAWQPEARLAAQGSEAHAGGDWSLALSGERIALAAPVLPKSGFNAGVVLLYERRAGSWQRVQALVPPAAGTTLGNSVALLGDLMVVGGSDQGTPVVWVYARNAEQWAQVQRIESSEPDPTFGEALALSSMHLAIASPGGATGLGRVHIYEHATGRWSLQYTLREVGAQYSQFGIRMAFHGDTLAVGPLEPNRVRLHVRRGSQWVPKDKLTVSGDPTARGSLALLGPRQVLLGAPAIEAAVFYDLSKPAAQREQAFQEPAGDEPPELEERGSAVAVGPHGAAIGAPSAWGRSGAVHLLQPRAGGWTLQQTLRPECAKAER